MSPIHDLLSRIRWGADFARSRFVIGYRDRVATKVQQEVWRGVILH
jgi:uncharacterized protein (UPF0248 family)